MRASYDSLGCEVTVRVRLGDLSSQDRFNLLVDLLRDVCRGETIGGDIEMASDTIVAAAGRKIGEER